MLSEKFLKAVEANKDKAVTMNIEEEEEMELKKWERKGYTVEMVEYDHDLKAFEVVQGDKVQTIYPATIEDMKRIIIDLDNGEDVDGWEDGLGNTIVIE